MAAPSGYRYPSGPEPTATQWFSPGHEIEAQFEPTPWYRTVQEACGKFVAMRAAPFSVEPTTMQRSCASQVTAISRPPDSDEGEAGCRQLLPQSSLTSRIGPEMAAVPTATQRPAAEQVADATAPPISLPCAMEVDEY